jgi:hypothetical protein
MVLLWWLTHTLKSFAWNRSGAYNRTLTPGFQSEQRNYWEVPEIYKPCSIYECEQNENSAFTGAWEADNNPGTFTLQTERYFQALA